MSRGTKQDDPLSPPPIQCSPRVCFPKLPSEMRPKRVGLEMSIDVRACLSNLWFANDVVLFRYLPLLSLRALSDNVKNLVCLNYF